MDTSQYDKKIEDLTVKINKTREKMTPVLETFLNETEKFIGEFFKDTMKKYVVLNPEITKNHHKKGSLQELRKECEELEKRIPELVEKNIATKFWIYNCPVDNIKKECETYELFSSDYKNFDANMRIIKSLRKILGLMGDLLLKYNYIEKEEEYDWEKSADGKFTYYGSIDCSSEMKTSLKNYLEMDNDLSMLYNEFNDIEKQKHDAENKAEAEELWNNT